MFSAVEKVVPHSPGVLDFAFVLVNSVVNLPDKWGELSFLRGGGGVWVGWGYSNCRRTVINPAYQNFLGGGVPYTKPPKRHLQNFPTQKNSRLTKFEPKKSLDHPRHLKSGIPSLGL